MVKAFFLAVSLAAASPALGQASQQQQQNPPQQNPPQQQPATQQPAPQQPQSQSTAGSQGQSSSAQPSSPGAASQQVVVNPPPSQQPSVQQPGQQSPPPSTTIVNPAPAYTPAPAYGDEVVVRRRAERNPMVTVATDAAYGGLAGLVIGFGVALVNQWDHWQRDITVGAGAGVLVGAAVGVAQATYDASEDRRARRVALDGMNRTDKDPVIANRPAMAFAFKF